MRCWMPDTRAALRWGEFFYCEPDWLWTVRALPHFDLWYVLRGHGWIEAGHNHISISGGDCLFLRQGASYRAGHKREQPLTLLAIYFDLLDGHGQRLVPPPEDLPPLCRRIEEGMFFRELLTRAIQAYKEGCAQWASAWLQAAIMELIREDVATWPAGPLRDQAHAIKRICERIRHHPAQPVHIGELARELNVSSKHFCRLFTRLQGMSPRAFITQTRIEAAQMLLLNSSHSITRIAELAGYSSPFQFSRQFKNKVGISPRAFRDAQTMQK